MFCLSHQEALKQQQNYETSLFQKVQILIIPEIINFKLNAIEIQ